MTAYPSDYPQPKIEGFAASVASGLIKTEDPIHQAQRRVFSTMPHTFALTFVMSVDDWALWHNWASSNGYGWFEINLPTMYAGLAATTLSPVLIRFISDVSAVAVSLNNVQVTVTAEIAPSMIVGYMEAV